MTATLITGRTNRAVLQLALRIDRLLADEYQQYLASCAADYERGYRPHYCEHGTDRWVDYDNICGGCEDGRTMSDPMQRRRAALDEAWERTTKVHALMDWWQAGRALLMHHHLPAKPVHREINRLMLTLPDDDDEQD